jgi:hypothetical protein
MHVPFGFGYDVLAQSFVAWCCTDTSKVLSPEPLILDESFGPFVWWSGTFLSLGSSEPSTLKHRGNYHHESRGY